MAKVNTFIKGRFGCVSVVHVVGLRIITNGSRGYMLQALTPEWAIDLDTFDCFDDASARLNALSPELRHQ